MVTSNVELVPDEAPAAGGCGWITFGFFSGPGVDTGISAKKKEIG